MHLTVGWVPTKCVNMYGLKTFNNLDYLFDRPHNYGYWAKDTGSHMTPTAYKVIANYIYEKIEPELNNGNTAEPQKTVKYQFKNEIDTFLEDNLDFKIYLNEQKSIKEKVM